MKLARGPRPWPVRLFALAFLAQALVGFGYQITRLPVMEAIFEAAWPEIPFTRDMTIVLICTRLTISLIPVALVWFFASRVARWLVLVFAILKLAVIPSDLARMDLDEGLSTSWLAQIILTVVGAALLFTRPAALWFANRGRRMADAFL